MPTGIVWIPVGGPDLDDPIITRRVPHTYHYPDGTGCLTLRENSFYMEAPMPLQPIRAKGTLELLPNQNMRYGILDPERGWIGPIDFVWIGDTLKVEDFEYSYSWRIVWYLYWVRQTDKRRQS